MKFVLEYLLYTGPLWIACGCLLSRIQNLENRVDNVNQYQQNWTDTIWDIIRILKKG